MNPLERKYFKSMSSYSSSFQFYIAHILHSNGEPPQGGLKHGLYVGALISRIGNLQVCYNLLVLQGEFASASP